MNVLTHLPFLRDFQSAIHHLDDRGRAFARGYGNASASAQAFAPLGRATPAAALPPRNPTRSASPRGAGVATAPATARRVRPDLCTSGACG